MLNATTKKLILGNVELLKYCNSACIDVLKLGQCNIERMGHHYVFGLKKENIPISTAGLPLDIDIASQPDVVLIMTVTEEDIIFETTEKTIRILNK